MFPINEATPNGFDAEVPFTLLLGLKELLLLTVILCLGFAGFSLCFDKIYNPNTYQDSIPNVTVYSPEVNDAYLTIASQSYGADVID